MIKVFVSGLFMIMLFYPIAHLFWTFIFVTLERTEKEVKETLERLERITKNENM